MTTLTGICIRGPSRAYVHTYTCSLTHMYMHVHGCLAVFVCTILWLQEAAVASLKGPASSSITPSAEGLCYVLRGPIWRPRSLLGRKTPQSPLIQGLQAIAQSEGKRLQTTGKQGERVGPVPLWFLPRKLVARRPDTGPVVTRVSPLYGGGLGPLSFCDLLSAQHPTGSSGLWWNE